VILPMRESGPGCARLPTRVHATTGEVPLVRLEVERERLQPMPPLWRGLIQIAHVKRAAPIPRGYQHSLKVYEELIAAVAG
jgi:hypothetical protein